MEKGGSEIFIPSVRSKVVKREKAVSFFYMLLTLVLFILVWQMAALKYNSELLLPTPLKTAVALYDAVRDPWILKNLLITLKRVLLGFLYALAIGVPLGYLMGYSKTVLQIMDPLIGSLRQVPIMAWVPLTIVWFGLGDGPTVFLIAFSGVFPIILNTIAGVQGIDRDYYHAARSMGAKPWHIFSDVIFPGSLPDIMTGMRIAVGAGWMSVICAEFIATSAGFGYAMVEAQTRMYTDKLIALMIMAGIVGYLIDRLLLFLNIRLIKWRYVA
ncbi:NitT/TauT family transport system permease protein [Thermosyntropha lipolytica DSM 11003]|uniref:NitT/TauT family transport system permease protein n=1 Tax=Thermosyntropha lipolytica DSM 11003 TaxID=1123382 RepID=A0A1M5JQ39_9FIRM|nr:ABC transporter permease subunit SaoP [Thermosyntropha lipolytica]SHG42696.1 NitT/TauT family transport system permease protein [Thermosyntropha lipolytica DSM 11003]